MSNRAIVLTRFGGTDALQLSSIEMPEAQPGGVVVRVEAAGINGLDWKIREGFLREIIPTVFPAILGLELAGEVTSTAPGGRFAVGDKVMGLAAPGQGAYAEYVAVPEELLVPVPAELAATKAAALPVAGLTAWQMLHAVDTPQSGSSVLVHGAAGGVGTILVQLAKQAGLKAIATASPASRSHLLTLGVDVVIDRFAEKFEEMAHDVDLVIDLAGGDAPDRSWSVLRPGGTLVSAVRPDLAAPRSDGRRGIWFQMQPDSHVLRGLVAAAASGELAVTISETVSLSNLPQALERNRTGHAAGKAVLDFALA